MSVPADEGLAPPALAALVRGRQLIAVTGAGGWIGLATLDLLARALGDGFADRVHAYGSTARVLDLGGGRMVAQRPLEELASLPGDGAWVLHLAFLGKERAAAMPEAEYRAANRRIADTVLAALDRINAAALFVASSGAATRAADPAADPATRLYGGMKRDDEERFAAWATARGRRGVIGRIHSVTGPYINKHEAYAIASFIRDALAGRPIAVRAPRAVVRGYVAIRELMTLVLALMAEPAGVVRFASGGEPLELAAVAQAVAATLGGTVARAPITDLVADRYAGDDVAYAALLAAHGIAPVSLDRQIAETARYMAAHA